MKLVKGSLAGLLAAMLVSGCQLAPLKSPPEAGARTPAPPTSCDNAQEALEVIELLAYYQRVSALPQDELRKEYNAASASLQREKTDLHRLRLALLLSVPGTSLRDDAKLVGLLEGAAARPANGETGSPPQRLLAQTLLRTTNERLRLVREEQKRAEALPREDAKRAEEANALARKLETQLSDEKRRGDELQKKLDALLSIERDLRSRSPQRRSN